MEIHVCDQTPTMWPLANYYTNLCQIRFERLAQRDNFYNSG